MRPGENSTDDICMDLNGEVHPDRAGDRVYSSTEVTTMRDTVNTYGAAAAARARKCAACPSATP